MTSADQNQLIAWAVAGVSFVLNVALVLKQLFSKDSPAPQPFLVKLEEAFVKKEDFEAFKADVHNQLKDMRAYLHDEIHALNNAQNATALNAQSALEKLREFIGGKFDDLDKKRSVSVARLHDELGGVRDRVSAVEQLADSLNQSQHAQDARIDAIRRPRG